MKAKRKAANDYGLLWGVVNAVLIEVAIVALVWWAFT